MPTHSKELQEIQRKRRENPYESRVFSCLLYSIQASYSLEDARGWLERRGFDEFGVKMPTTMDTDKATADRAAPMEIQSSANATGGLPPTDRVQSTASQHVPLSAPGSSARDTPHSGGAEMRETTTQENEER